LSHQQCPIRKERKMTFAEAVRSVYSNYAKFDGRSRRSEYWYFALFVFVAYLAGVVLAKALGSIAGILGTTASIVLVAFWLATLVPSIAVGIRRLHDTGRSGWWLLIGLIPIIGSIVLIVFYVQDSQPEANAYGPSPKGTGMAVAPPG
jgi:uncharacterized membrane protein YhaH (DUF805 family)